MITKIIKITLYILVGAGLLYIAGILETGRIEQIGL